MMKTTQKIFFPKAFKLTCDQKNSGKVSKKGYDSRTPNRDSKKHSPVKRAVVNLDQSDFNSSGVMSQSFAAKNQQQNETFC